MRCWAITGLVLDICGALLLVWGELGQRATLVKYFRDNDIDALPLWKRIPVNVLVSLFGSADVEEVNEQPPEESLATMFWAILLLVVGFALQLVSQVGSF